VRPVSSVCSKRLVAVRLIPKPSVAVRYVISLGKALPEQAMNDTWRHTKLLSRYFSLGLALTAS
jgi:hypothetical protein